jgi:hypothetical protein
VLRAHPAFPLTAQARRARPGLGGPEICQGPSRAEGLRGNTLIVGHIFSGAFGGRPHLLGRGIASGGAAVSERPPTMFFGSNQGRSHQSRSIRSGWLPDLLAGTISCGASSTDPLGLARCHQRDDVRHRWLY